MSVPEGLTTVPVAGVIAGSPLMPGDALFECNIWNQNPATGRIVPPFPVRAPIYASGAISVDLPVTDDPAYEQVGWQYTVTLRWGTHIIQGSLAVPRATVGVLNLAANLVLHQPADAGLVDYLTAADKGIPGGVAGLDPITGKVPAAQLPSGSGGGGVLTWAELEGKPTVFPPSAHGHPISEITGLQAALDGKQAAGSYAAATHGHAISQITGLQTALDGKQAAGSYATAADLTAVASRVTAVEDMTPLVLLWNGLAYVEAPLGRVYVGPVDPGAVADGSVWISTA